MGGAPYFFRVYRNAVVVLAGRALQGVTKDAVALQRVQEIMKAHPGNEAASNAINAAIWEGDKKLKAVTELMRVAVDSTDVEIFDKEYTDS